MNRSAPRPIIEILVETGAALSLGGACAFAVSQVGPLAATVVTGLIVAGAAACISARVDRPRTAFGGHFELVDFLFDAADASILLLDDPILVDEDELLLDDPLLNDPLPREQDDGRVVCLFTAARPVPADQATIVDPSEMVTRIEEFLANPRAAAAAGNAASDDASAALQAALADIRRSLRQA